MRFLLTILIIIVVRNAILFLLWFLFCLLPYFLIFLGMYLLFLFTTYYFLVAFHIPHYNPPLNSFSSTYSDFQQSRWRQLVSSIVSVFVKGFIYFLVFFDCLFQFELSFEASKFYCVTQSTFFLFFLILHSFCFVATGNS
jgi:hypothetical protein